MESELKRHFHIKKWKGGGEETVSGKGSTLAYTEQLRPALAEFLRKFQIQTLLDAPCGDFNWMNHVEMTGIEYIGLDIIDEVIASNSQKYARPDRTFRVADITVDELPPADLMLCRDCTFHLPFVFVWALLRNFVRSDIPLLLMTNHITGQNVDLDKPGGYQSRDFLSEPFLLPRPRADFWLNDNSGGKGNRFLCLWTKEQVAGAMEKAKEAGRLPE